MLRVLVTRPEPGALRTARQLRETGFLPILLPLTETVALPVDAGLVPDDAIAVAITSANAVRHAPEDVIAALAALPCHAVGKRTAEAAREAGFLSVSEGPGNAEGLAGSLAADLSGKTIVYLCGRVRFPAFEHELKAASVQVHAVETYDTLQMGYSDETILERLSGQPADAVLLYSAKAAAAMQVLARRPALHGLFEKTWFFALSNRIAAILDDTASERIRIAAQPDEEALLALLRA
ncbi:uroporphyrinogen-III synthase [Mesorhizobium sp. M7D.F.Ca.US.005.01.1.1]|uniref:Uroporphyrinogen-III synthase n=1 Tax=Rhizobium loti TaxID=381 RepID=A0A8E3B5B6_RHILI|nr:MULTISPECIES: uroporphyrinogen-III synthase [Mesorhizobium]AZO40184.1 uroporphyrinogen-III synthase [Mesorhizobium sp. M7D.F.Ca.US.005.01.1.1]PWJ91556.1 uroporphyrinogen-III synthase [Mesorhizobium loti]